MEKILQILAVFAVLMLVIVLFFRTRETRYHPYGYLRRIKPLLPEELRQRLVPALTGAAMEGQRMLFPVDGEADALLFDAETRLLFIYRATGSLVVYRQTEEGRRRERQPEETEERTGEEVYKEKQWLAAPLDCTGFFFDPEDKKLYFEAGGSLFVYGA
jgi:hypothetical protein